MNISIKYFFHIIWIFCVTSEKLDTKEDVNFVPVTQQPLAYFPQPRIVGGQDAKDNQFPYQISIRLNNRHICGGTIISKAYVVTAAHCVSTGSRNSFKK